MNEDDYKYLIGKTAEEVKAEKLPTNVRIIQFGHAYTMDFCSTRLNIFLDEDGKVEKVAIH